jgi:hypothetical protein
MIKEFLIKQALKYKAKDLPKEQVEMLTKAMGKNPELFKKIEKEIEALTKKGKPEFYAAIDIRKKYEKELLKVFQDK